MESRFFFKTFLTAFVFFSFGISFAFSYEVILKNGKTVSGKLVAENEQTIVLKDASGTQISLKKINVDLPKTQAANRNEAAPLSVGVQPSNGSNHQSSEPSVAPSDTKGNEAMTNQTVIDLFTAKTGDSVIISLIKHSSTKFDLSPTAILQLKKVGLSDSVIEAMIDTEGTAATSAPAVTDEGNVGLPKDIGVYLRKDSGWVEVDPEVVNWQTGGVMKHVFSAGIVKQDLNGQIRGPHCGNAIEIPAEFLVIAPEGISITEYQLIKLRENDQYREFRTVTGGVFHVSGGAKRDLIPFEGTKIASRTFKVVLQDLQPGEYGFLPPGAFTAAGASSSLGKMYTFSIGRSVK